MTNEPWWADDASLSSLMKALPDDLFKTIKFSFRGVPDGAPRWLYEVFGPSRCKVIYFDKRAQMTWQVRAPAWELRVALMTTFDRSPVESWDWTNALLRALRKESNEVISAAVTTFSLMTKEQAHSFWKRAVKQLKFSVGDRTIVLDRRRK